MLQEVLLHETEANRYVKIYISVYLVAMCFIDYEDLFLKFMDYDLLHQEVESIELVDDPDFNEPIYKIKLK